MTTPDLIAAIRRAYAATNLRPTLSGIGSVGDGETRANPYTALWLVETGHALPLVAADWHARQVNDWGWARWGWTFSGMIRGLDLKYRPEPGFWNADVMAGIEVGHEIARAFGAMESSVRPTRKAGAA
jgi:hypothetical protein